MLICVYVISILYGVQHARDRLVDNILDVNRNQIPIALPCGLLLGALRAPSVFIDTQDCFGDDRARTLTCLPVVPIVFSSCGGGGFTGNPSPLWNLFFYFQSYIS